MSFVFVTFFVSSVCGQDWRADSDVQGQPLPAALWHQTCSHWSVAVVLIWDMLSLVSCFCYDVRCAVCGELFVLWHQTYCHWSVAFLSHVILHWLVALTHIKWTCLVIGVHLAMRLYMATTYVFHVAMYCIIKQGYSILFFRLWWHWTCGHWQKCAA